MSRLQTSLRQARLAAALSQEALAAAVGVSRQADADAERGSGVPSTEIALRLARALGTTVEALFALPETARPAVIAEPIGGEPVETAGQRGRLARGGGPRGGEPVETAGQRVRLLRVGGRWLARPLSGPTSGSRALAWADGIARP